MEDGLGWVYIRTFDMSKHLFINALNGKLPPELVATSRHVLMASSARSDSWLWLREAQGSGGHIPSVGARRGKEGVGGAAGGKRCRPGC